MSTEIKKVIDRILLPLGKVLKGVETDGLLNVHGYSQQWMQLPLFSSDKGLKLTVHAGDVITKTNYLVQALLYPNQKQIVLQPKQWLILSDVEAAPIIAGNPNPGKTLAFKVNALGYGLKITADDLAMAKDVTTNGFALSSPTSNLVIQLNEDS